MKEWKIRKAFLLVAFLAVGVGVLGYGLYYYWVLNQLNDSLEIRIAALEQSLELADQSLSLTKKENSNLAEALVNEQNKNQLFETQIRDISGVVGGLSGTVGALEKLSRIDPELLKKYSKVYFLSEHYTPTQLGVVDARYIYDRDNPQQVHVKVLPFLLNMLSAAEADNIDFKIVSAYRSFGTQAAVKSGYKVTYGSGANQFSAEQGYSEHQLGSALDFTSPEISEVFYGFEKTETYKWLTENAYKFGFVLSYPPDNSYYQFEPWHWRFVGTALATKLHNDNEYLYDLPQREIDEYLVSIFD